MKNISYILLLLICILSATTLTAKSNKYKGKMSVLPQRLEQIGDSLHIGIKFDIQGVNVDSRRSISLIPLLVAPGVDKKLPEVMIKGRANYLVSKREVALMNKKKRSEYNKNKPYAIVKGYKSREQKQVLYTKTIAFEPWMKDARLDIQEDLCGCGAAPRSLSVAHLVNQVQLELLIAPYQITPFLAYVQPEVEAVKRREMVGEAFLDFVVAKIDIRPDYMNNPRELKRITDMVQEVHNDPAITVKAISIEGYASPEGSLKFNKFLSEGRANALVNYLLPKFDYPQHMYSVVFGGENWKGLAEIVSNSNLVYKENVLSILNNRNISDDARKGQIKNLLSGVPYQFMLKEYYPSLRKAICKIDYVIKGFDVVEAKEVFKVRPQNLSMNEMYVVANTFDAGSQDFIDIFETAVRLYPSDVTANLNAASAALTRKDMVSAKRYLDKIEGKTSVAEYHNALGVLLMLNNEFDNAKVELEKAANSGLEAAKQNLKELSVKLENIELIRKQQKK